MEILSTVGLIRKIINAMKEKSKRLFGEMLVEDAIITRAQLEEALAIQEKQRAENSGPVSRVGAILGNLGYLDKQTLEKYIEKVMMNYF